MYDSPDKVSTNDGITDTEQFLQDAIASIPAAYAVFNAQDNSIVFSNDRFKKEFGIAEKTCSMLDLVPVSQHPYFLTQLKNLENNDRNKYAIYNIKNGAGELCDYYAYFSRLKQAGTDAFYNVLFHKEESKWPLPFISFDSREMYLEQFHEFGFGTFEWSVPDDRMYWSDSMNTIFEIREGDEGTISDKASFFKLIHPEDKARVDKLITESLETGASFKEEIRFITAKQNVKTIALSGDVVRDDNSAARKLVGSIKDITEQRQIESDLKNNLEELNRSNQELEEFAYVASHDLQEPLRKISTFCSRISEKYKDRLDSEGQMYIERVLVSAENMRMLITNLLEFSRVARDTQPFTSVNLTFVLHQVKTDLELLIEETEADVVIDKLPTISGSLTQLKQLFHNLITNAIKFRKTDEKASIAITTDTLTEEQKIARGLRISATYYQISVKDNGIGFDNQYSARIFQIFQRLHGKSEYPGSGIGLAICKKIVEHHHGFISAEGVPGEGAIFHIILPQEQV